jgi:hypothetical protein
MDVLELDYSFDIKKLTEECNYLINNVGLHEHHYQISLKHTGIDDYGDKWYQGCGSLVYSFDGKNVPVERKTKLEQIDFVEVNSSLKNTYIEEIYNIVSNDYSIGRFRLMAIPHKKCMSMHVDTSKRIHIPVVTNENCLMIIDNQVYHMPSNGNAYLVDTTKPHTALNANHSFMRLHLLFDLY